MSPSITLLYEKFLASGLQVCTDTRKLIPNSIFFALKGDNFNANEFALKSLEQGCSYAVIDEERYKSGERTILVKDALETLQALAHHHRKQFEIPFIAITGSNGKTTTKELINAVLSKKYNTLATQGNLNNHIGVPLTLLSVRKEHEMAIIEMGANHQGEIDLLCRIADPDYGIITNVGKAHLEGFGGIEGVIKGKSELYRYILEKKGKIFVHGDDEVLNGLLPNNDKITYGTKKLYDVIGKLNEKAEQVEFAWKTRYTAPQLKDAPFLKTQLVGIYNYYNLLCAACVGITFRVEEQQINEALTSYVPSNMRSQLLRTAYNTLILDYYNANPSSMSAAIENFSKMNAANKMLVLGDMLELGEDTVKEHQHILDLLREKQLENYVLVGPVFNSISREKSFTDSDKAYTYLKQLHLKENTILIKGSRGIKLENVLEAF
ncbi:MAG: UDP-N-acetylmuramoyl-tripeptide--D-alanyl-D-alanine ligase [Bacteroidia bacterium]